MTDLTPTELARALAARRHTVAGVCAVCGTPFIGLPRRKYCSERCKQAVKNAKNRRLANQPRRTTEGTHDGDD